MGRRCCGLVVVVLAGCSDHAARRPPPLPIPDPYADLAPLARAIGDARVVALGEPSHAEGNMFETQARLVAFLHDRLGFTVLAWEAGLWSCETDAAHCVGWPWGAVVETHAVRPPPPGIRVTGFDFQLTGSQRERSLELLRDRLQQLVAPDTSLATRLSTAFERFPKLQHFRLLGAADRALDRQAFNDALAALEARKDVQDRDLLQRAMENVLGLYDWHEAVHADVSTTIDWSHNALNNVRDKAMADNVLWLMNVRYPGQKIILWCATFHAARALAVLTDPPADDPLADRSGFRPMGQSLSDALGASYFALGMTSAYEGRIGNPPQQAEMAVGAAPPGSIDQLWAPSAGASFRFVPRAGLGDAPTLARFIGLHGSFAPWDRVLDGGLVFRTVTPATPETP